MSFSGDINALGRIAASLDALADVPRVASELVAERIEKLIDLEFSAGVDPYGEAWASLAPRTVARGRHAPPLTDLGELRDSVLARPRAAGGLTLSIGTPDSPAGPHEFGWSGPQGSGPARPMLPEHGLPQAWEWAIEDAVVESATAKLAEVSR